MPFADMFAASLRIARHDSIPKLFRRRPAFGVPTKVGQNFTIRGDNLADEIDARNGFLQFACSALQLPFDKKPQELGNALAARKAGAGKHALHRLANGLPAARPGCHWL